MPPERYVNAKGRLRGNLLAMTVFIVIILNVYEVKKPLGISKRRKRASNTSNASIEKKSTRNSAKLRDPYLCGVCFEKLYTRPQALLVHYDAPAKRLIQCSNDLIHVDCGRMLLPGHPKSNSSLKQNRCPKSGVKFSDLLVLPDAEKEPSLYLHSLDLKKTNEISIGHLSNMLAYTNNLDPKDVIVKLKRHHQWLQERANNKSSSNMVSQLTPATSQTILKLKPLSAVLPVIVRSCQRLSTYSMASTSKNISSISKNVSEGNNNSSSQTIISKAPKSTRMSFLSSARPILSITRNFTSSSLTSFSLFSSSDNSSKTAFIARAWSKSVNVMSSRSQSFSRIFTKVTINISDSIKVSLPNANQSSSHRDLAEAKNKLVPMKHQQIEVRKDNKRAKVDAQKIVSSDTLFPEGANFTNATSNFRHRKGKKKHHVNIKVETPVSGATTHLHLLSPSTRICANLIRKLSTAFHF